MRALITKWTIVTAKDTYTADVRIEGETIAAIGTKLTAPVDKTIDATGKFVIHGGIETHTHLDIPFGGSLSVDEPRALPWPDGTPAGRGRARHAGSARVHSAPSPGTHSQRAEHR